MDASAQPDLYDEDGPPLGLEGIDRPPPANA
jgi:hypothetical protein